MLRGALATGIAMALGVAIIDAAYAGLARSGRRAAGDRRAARRDRRHRRAVLAWFAVRTLWSAFRIRLGAEADEEVATPRAAL